MGGGDSTDQLSPRSCVSDPVSHTAVLPVGESTFARLVQLGCRNPLPTPRRIGAEEGASSARDPPSDFSTSPTPEGSSAPAPGSQAPHGLAKSTQLGLSSPPTGGSLHDAADVCSTGRGDGGQTSLHAADRSIAWTHMDSG